MKIPIVILLIALLVCSSSVANASDFMERQDRLYRPSQAPGTLQDNSIVTPSNWRMECESHVCPGRCRYSSIQTAIDAAKPGDTICIAPHSFIIWNKFSTIASYWLIDISRIQFLSYNLERRPVPFRF